MNFDELPVRTETLEAAWEITQELERPQRVVILVTLRAQPGMMGRLEAAARDFVDATPGPTQLIVRGDLLYLLERFADEEAFGRHMASDYFARFQVEQRPLIVEPVEALFLERG